ncbi:MAG: DNA-directed DNA polymerase I [Promethearchaeia archaeon]
MAKKKDNKDKSQSSLFSFVDDSKKKQEKQSTKEKQKEKERTEKPEETKKKEEKKKVKRKKRGVRENVSKQTEEEKKDKKDETQKDIKEIPKDLFFEGSDTPFGIQAEEVNLKKIKRENISSRYIRYLIKKGDIVKDLEKGLLLDVGYDGGENKAVCKFYDLETGEIKIWLDTTDHEPYCLSKESIAQLENNIELTNYSGLERFEAIKRIDLLRDKDIEMTKIYGETPTDIGGSRSNIRKILGSGNAWEANIRYHLNYIYDRNLFPGLIYTMKNGKLERLEYYEDENNLKTLETELTNLFKDTPEEMQEFATSNLDVFLTPIPEVNRLALDIEVQMGPNQKAIPNPRQVKQPIISVSLVANDGLKKVFMLEREGFSYGELHEKFPEDAELIFFKNEKTLIEETFRLIWEYPILVTFNGDNFDLNYLSHRATKLKVERDLNPIHVKRGYGFLSRAECNLRRGIHIDLFNFFFNRSIAGYAFGGAYDRSSLNSISSALLGKEKYSHEEEIHELNYGTLAWYNLKDSILTLELTQFNNSLVWNLIILLCRITKMPIHDMIRHQISSWIQNIFFFEHRQQNFLIPLRREISELKKGGYSKSTVEGKGFKGAYVIPPEPGIYFDVVVMDFASLYPSIIKEYNLSYETVQCPHDECIENMIKGTPYHVCKHKMGIFAYVVGFFRDIRVKYFKPKSKDESLPEQRRSYYYTIQQALKVFINGSYGVFGSKNFPLFCLPVAESTTGIGRYSIKSTVEKAKEMGIDVLYGDSDSVFLHNPSQEKLEKLSQWSKEELDLDLEEEKIYQFLGLSDRKKNYIGIHKDTQYVDMKGLLAKKKNTPDFIKKVFEGLIEILKDITTMEEFEKAKNNIIETVRKSQKKIGRKGAFPLEDYAINISLRKKLDNYNKTTPQHVRAALDLKRRTGKELQKGDVVSFIKSKDSAGAKAISLAKIQDLNVRKYKELLRSALEQVLDALGITYEEIKGIKKMDTFF